MASKDRFISPKAEFIYQTYTDSDFTWDDGANNKYFQKSYTLPSGYKISNVSVIWTNGVATSGVALFSNNLRVCGVRSNGSTIGSDWKFTLELTLRKE